MNIYSTSQWKNVSGRNPEKAPSYQFTHHQKANLAHESQDTTLPLTMDMKPVLTIVSLDQSMRTTYIEVAKLFHPDFSEITGM